jgi:hypothetical protein
MMAIELKKTHEEMVEYFQSGDDSYARNESGDWTCQGDDGWYPLWHFNCGSDELESAFQDWLKKNTRADCEGKKKEEL